MIFFLALAIALPLAVIRGGRPAEMSSVRFRLVWLIFVALGFQVAVVYLPWFQAAGRYEFPAVIIIISYVMALAWVIANQQLGGIRLIGLGLLLNLVVIVANGGFMPISPEAANDMGLLSQGLAYETGTRVASSKDILLEPESTTLWALSDIFVPGRYIPVRTIFSIGDAIAAVGLFVAIQRAMLPKGSTRLKGPSGAASGVD
ncbi:MAG: DUF5317 family protein [Dehalococcoidia bacterium]|nr:DUF5317 family protein [Dehalococcoidia bacterium]